MQRVCRYSNLRRELINYAAGIVLYFLFLALTYGGFMISVLDSGSSGLGRAPAEDIALSSWARHLPLSTRVYKWVLAYLMLGEALHAMDWHNNNNNNNKLQIYIAQFPWRDDQLRITKIHGIK